jgi:hypothetical protein
MLGRTGFLDVQSNVRQRIFRPAGIRVLVSRDMADCFSLSAGVFFTLQWGVCRPNQRIQDSELLLWRYVPCALGRPLVRKNNLLAYVLASFEILKPKNMKTKNHNEIKGLYKRDDAKAG